MTIHYAEKPLALEKKQPVEWVSLYKRLHEQQKIIFNQEQNTIQFLNYAGFFTANNQTYLVYPQKLENLFSLEKTPEENFLQFYSQVLNKILTSIPPFLLFNLSPTFLPVQEDFSPHSLLYQLFILLYKKDEILESFALLQKEPHQTLQYVEVEKLFHQVKKANQNTLFTILKNLDNLQPHKTGVLQGVNQRYSPITLQEQEAQETFNTPENRFIKDFLTQLSYLCFSIQKKFQDLPEITKIIRSIQEETDYLLENSFLNQVGDLKNIPYTSQVLQKKTGYKELFSLSSLLFSGFIPQTLKKLNSAFYLKDLATLWEYYCLSFLINLFSQITNNPRPRIEPPTQNRDYETMRVFFGPDLILHYQKTFHSYSRLEWRPDFYLEINHKKIVFDAKFRFFEENKKDVLQNLHYYKDGLSLNQVFALTLPNRLNQKTGSFYIKNKKETLNFNNEELKKILWDEFFPYYNDFGVGFFPLPIQD
ncbi:MAG: DUF2357 domain-containing protein [Proteobacteria bacterium]|nr:DUF2357 domain-containing protein [Pseudomonadota bacterium]